MLLPEMMQHVSKTMPDRRRRVGKPPRQPARMDIRTRHHIDIAGDDMNARAAGRILQRAAHEIGSDRERILAFGLDAPLRPHAIEREALAIVLRHALGPEHRLP